MKIKKYFSNPFWVIEVHGDLEENELLKFREQLNEEMEAGHQKVAMDLWNVTGICSLALGMIVKYIKQFSHNRGTLVILRPNEIVRSLLEQTKLTSVVAIVKDEKELSSLP